MRVTESPAFLASRQYANATYLKALFHFGHTIGLFFITIGLMFATLQIHYGLTLLLSLVAATAYLRLFMIGHGSTQSITLQRATWINAAMAM